MGEKVTKENRANLLWGVIFGVSAVLALAFYFYCGAGRNIVRSFPSDFLWLLAKAPYRFVAFILIALACLKGDRRLTIVGGSVLCLSWILNPGTFYYLFYSSDLQCWAYRVMAICPLVFLLAVSVREGKVKRRLTGAFAVLYVISGIVTVFTCLASPESFYALCRSLYYYDDSTAQTIGFLLQEAILSPPVMGSFGYFLLRGKIVWKEKKPRSPKTAGSNATYTGTKARPSFLLSDTLDELEKAAKFREQGILTEEEFQKTKSELLKNSCQNSMNC